MGCFLAVDPLLIAFLLVLAELAPLATLLFSCSELLNLLSDWFSSRLELCSVSKSISEVFLRFLFDFLLMLFVRDFFKRVLFVVLLFVVLTILVFVLAVVVGGSSRLSFLADFLVSFVL